MCPWLGSQPARSGASGVNVGCSRATSASNVASASRLPIDRCEGMSCIQAIVIPPESKVYCARRWDSDAIISPASVLPSVSAWMIDRRLQELLGESTTSSIFELAVSNGIKVGVPRVLWSRVTRICMLIEEGEQHGTERLIPRDSTASIR